MTRYRVALAAVVLALAVAGLAFAQPQGGRRGGGPGGPGRGPGFGPPIVELRGLDLSDVQRDQVKQITDRHREEMRNEIFAILTPDQLTKAKQLEAERESRMKQRLEQLQQRKQQ